MRRYRLSLTPSQTAAAAHYAGSARLVWNVGLEHRITAFRLSGRRVTYAEQCRELTVVRGEFPWLAAVPVHALQQALLDLDRSFRRFRAGISGFPRFKRRGDRESFRFPDRRQFEIRRLSKKWGEVRFPKLGWCRVRWTRSLGGVARNATLKREGKHWHVCFCVQTAACARPSLDLPPVGVDVGVATSVATSEGEHFRFQSLKPGETERLRRLQKKLARQVRGSRSREKTRQAIASLHLRARNRRADFLHKTSTGLAHTHGLVAIEDLSIPSMTRSARGTVPQPGRNVAQKAGLNRAILDKAWGGLASRLKYKCDERGSLLVRVAPAFTSLTCCRCGHCERQNRPERARFVCQACGWSANADVNAASVILQRALANPRVAKRYTERSAPGFGVAARGDLLAAGR